MQVDTKCCSVCKTYKDLNEYSTHKVKYKDKTYTYYREICKACNLAKLVASLPVKHEEWKQMKTPTPWDSFKGVSTIPKHKIYPICKQGHRYVGKRCLPCKYSLQHISKVVR